MYLKSPKGSRRFSSSLTRDVLIAFRMTAKLFSSRKEVSNKWIIIRNGTTKLCLFTDLFSASLLGTTNLFFTYDKFSTAVLDQKRCNGRLLLTGKRWVVRYTIYPFSTAAPFTTVPLPNQDLIGPKKKTHEN